MNQRHSSEASTRAVLRAACCVAMLAAMRAEAASTCVRSFPTYWYSPGQVVHVTIQATPDATAQAWAVEETPPTGWTISSINNGGAWDAVNQKVKWGPFFGSQAQSLSYDALPPAGEIGVRTFSGRLSVNGASQATTGDATLVDADSVQFTLVTSVLGGHGTIEASPSRATYAAGTIVNLTAVPEDGYRVAAWIGTSNDGSVAMANTVTMNGNKTVSVRFEPIPAGSYALTASVIGGNGTISPTSGTYAAGTVVTLTATPDAGYRVLVWSGTDNDGATANSNTVTMSAARVVTVRFEPIPAGSYALTASVIGGNGTISPTSGTYAVGTVVTLTATPDAGYCVLAWSGTDNDGSTANSNTVTMSAARVVTVRFEPIPAGSYALTASVIGGNGTITPTSGTYAAGTVVTLTATPDAGYRVVAWHGTNDDESTAVTNAVTMDADRSVVVVFGSISEVSYALVAMVVGGHGSISPAGGSYAAGTVVSLAAVPHAGYRVASWQGTDDDAVRSEANTVTMNANRVVIVQFEPAPVAQYALTASVLGGHGTVAPTSGTYADGTTVTLTATPDSGYRLLAWAGTDDDISRATTNTVTMTASRMVIVQFELIPVVEYTLTAGVDGGNGTVSPTSGTYAAGTIVTLTATPNTGYRVSSWSGTDDDDARTTTNTVTLSGNRSVMVTFEAIPVPPVSPNGPAENPVSDQIDDTPAGAMACGACGAGIGQAAMAICLGLTFMRFVPARRRW